MLSKQAKAISSESRRIDLAILESQDAINADPENWEAHYNLANIYFSRRDYKLSEEIFLKILNAGNRSYTVYRGLGNVYYAQKDFKKAADYFEKAVELKYKDPESHYALAVVYFKLNKVELFVQECTRALVVDKNFARAHYSMGFYYAQMKKYDHAIKELVQATKLSAADPEAHFLLMNIYLKKGMEREAMEQCLETLKYNPKHIAAHAQLAKFAEQHEDYSTAVHEYLEVKRLDSGYPEISKKISQTLEKEEKKYFEEIKQKPKNDQPYLALADLYYDVGRFDLAAQQCEEALTVNSKSIQAYSNLGVIYASVDKYIKAIVEYKKALVIDPNNKAVKDNLNRAYRYGLQYYKKVVEKETDNQAAWDSIIIIFKEMDDYISILDTYEKRIEVAQKNGPLKEAFRNFGVAYLQQALDIMKHDKTKVYQVGIGYLAIGDYAAAEEVFSIILKNSPKDVVVLYLMGRTQLKLGNLSRALEYLQKAYKLNSSYRDTYIRIVDICSREVEILIKKLTGTAADVSTLFEIAKVYEAQYLYRDAFEYYRKALFFDQTNTEIKERYTQSRENVIAELKRYVDQAALDETLYLQLGELYEEDSLLSKAISVYDRGLQLFPKSKSLFEKHYAASKHAVEEFEKYLEGEPNNSEMLFALALFAATVGYQLKALVALEKAVQIDPALIEQAKIRLEFRDLRGNHRFREIVHAETDFASIDKYVE